MDEKAINQIRATIDELKALIDSPEDSDEWRLRLEQRSKALFMLTMSSGPRRTI